MKFDYTHCFLCGKELNDENKSEEHIFPKWIQRRHNLWNQKLILFNNTSISYKNLLIPCCKECNGKYLSALENKIRRACENGFDAFIKLDEQYIFL
jgi:hypothetical protein